MAVQPPIKPSTAQYHVTARGGSQPVTNTASQAAKVAKGQATAPRLTPQRTNKSHSKAASDTRVLVDQESSFDLESKACNSHGNGEDVAVLRSVPVHGQSCVLRGGRRQQARLTESVPCHAVHDNSCPHQLCVQPPLTTSQIARAVAPKLTASRSHAIEACEPALVCDSPVAYSTWRNRIMHVSCSAVARAGPDGRLAILMAAR